MTTPKTEAERIDEAAETLWEKSKLDWNGYEQGFKDALKWRDANPLPHPDTVKREINIDTQNGQHSAEECDDPICSHY